jgi:hypothetical protein
MSLAEQANWAVRFRLAGVAIFGPGDADPLTDKAATNPIGRLQLYLQVIARKLARIILLSLGPSGCGANVQGEKYVLGTEPLKLDVDDFGDGQGYEHMPLAEYVREKVADPNTTGALLGQLDVFNLGIMERGYLALHLNERVCARQRSKGLAVKLVVGLSQSA